MKTTIVKSLFASLLTLVLTTSCGGSAGTKQDSNKGTNKGTNEGTKATKATLTTFPTPEIPLFITTREEQSKYLVDRYWDKFDFSDTTLISLAAVTEQGFSNFISNLSFVDTDQANSAIIKMLSKAQVADSMMFNHFLELVDKYLADPNSPLRSEDHYITVLNYIIASPKISDVDKAHSRYQLDIVMKNRPGDIATDFEYKLKSGKVGTLSKLRSNYTILFFNNPDCGDCARVKRILSSSPHVAHLDSLRELKILSIYPDEDLTAWLEEDYPEGWINGYDSKQYLMSKKMYDLKAIPSLYLLDVDKRVILKDASVEGVVVWLKDKFKLRNN